jgi:hypothetical protein
MLEIDDTTVAYIVEHRKHFEDLRQVAAELAGLLVLAAAGSKSALPDHPMLAAAGQLFDDTCDAVRCARPTSRARQHHDHLLRASVSLGTALLEARRRFGRSSGDLEIDPILLPLRSAYADLQQAAHALPGFEMVAFQQGCCALHGDVR